MKKLSLIILMFFIVSTAFSEEPQFWEYKIVRLKHRLTEKQLTVSFGYLGWELCNYYEDDPIDPVKVAWNDNPLNARGMKWNCVLKTIYIYTFKKRAYGEVEPIN